MYILPSAIIKNLEILHTFGNLFKNKSVIKNSNWSLSHTLKNVTFYKHTYVKTYNTPQRELKTKKRRKVFLNYKLPTSMAIWPVFRFKIRASELLICQES